MQPITANDLTQAEVQRLLDYDPETGVFTNRVSRGRNAGVGAVTGSTWIKPNRRSTYVRIRINKRAYFAHRLAWLYMHGRWPKEQIDHIDENGMNNSLANLREATQSENRQNISLPRAHNTTGLKGVSVLGGTYRRKPYLAHLAVDKVHVLCKAFATLEEARAARREAELKYHPFSKIHAEI